MSNKILVLQHSPSETLGLFEDELKKANFTWETLIVSGDTLWPSSVKLEEYGGFIILGGPMGVYEKDKYPWISKELMVVQEILRQKKPILGVCLGAQIIAEAAGGRVYPGHGPEIGWFPIRLDDWFYKRNPCFFQIDPTKPHTVFQWHGDTFELPSEAYRLAWNDNYRNQAFCFNGNAIGLQFHVEVTEDMVRDWLVGDWTRKQVVASGSDPNTVLADVPKHMASLKDLAHKIFYGFASLVRDNRRKAA
jgi:GMP synthase (glutamine-hydrolysing)